MKMGNLSKPTVISQEEYNDLRVKVTKLEKELERLKKDVRVWKSGNITVSYNWKK